MINIKSTNMEPNQFSISIKDQILQDFPEWEKYWKKETKELGNNINITYIIFEIPTPIEANVDSELLVYTMDDEVTVCFDYYHSHFDNWRNDIDSDESTAFRFVENLLNERTSVISYWQNTLWRGSSQLSNTNDYKPNLNIEYNKVRIRSWNGKHNADIEIA